MSETKRWTVTYTKHVRQKRKVYQDGVLELHSSSNKVFLYDDSEKLLDSKFLKKDELVECGGTLAFEAHLVDVGDPEGNFKPLTDLNGSCRDKKSDEKAGKFGQNARHVSSLESKKNERQCTSMRHNPSVNRKRESDSCRSQDSCRNAIPTTLSGNKGTELQNSNTILNHPKSIQSSVREWNALYTTQITQKAKRYHDGIVRLLACGSHMNQVILLNEDGDTLSSKYVKSIECVKTGSTYDLPNYLVQICEPRSIQEDVKESSLEEVMVTGKSKDRKLTSSRRVPRDEPFRDACQILSILRKPLPGESLVTRQLLLEQTHHSQSSVLLRPDLWGGSTVLKPQASETRCSKNFTEDRHEEDSENLSSQSATQLFNAGKDCSKFQSCEEISYTSISTSIDERKSQPESSASIHPPSGIEEYNTPATEEVKYADVITPEMVTFILESEVAGTNISSEGKKHISGAPSNLLKGQISADQSSSSIKQISSYGKVENSNQLCAESIKAEEKICEKGICSASSCQTSGDICSSSKNNMITNDFPSFDLGI